MNYDESVIYLMALRYAIDRLNNAPSIVMGEIASKWEELDLRVKEMIIMELKDFYPSPYTDTDAFTHWMELPEPPEPDQNKREDFPNPYKTCQPSQGSKGLKLRPLPVFLGKKNK